MCQYTLVLSQGDIIWPGVIQGFGLGLVFVPLSAASFATLPGNLRPDGTACIVDYKTGTPPSGKMIFSGFSLNSSRQPVQQK